MAKSALVTVRVSKDEGLWGLMHEIAGLRKSGVEIVSFESQTDIPETVSAKRIVKPGGPRLTSYEIVQKVAKDKPEFSGADIKEALKDHGFHANSSATLLKSLENKGFIRIIHQSPRGSRKPHTYSLVQQPE